MKTILIIGAGRSSVSLIDNLLHHASSLNYMVKVADKNFDWAKDKINGHPNGIAKSLDIFNNSERQQEIQSADIVISMLPARFHLLVAKDCLQYEKNLLTASYLSDELKDMDEEVKAKNLLFLNEMGLDPGIDHMSAKIIIDEIHEKGGKFKSFKSFCGGLIAPESDNNPWHYKFTWNPRNVVLAGQGTAQFLQHGRLKYIPYHNLFNRTEEMNILSFGQFEAYANRDSIGYKKFYDLDYIPTLYRGTLRRPGYSKAWNLFVQLGMTDDSYLIEVEPNTTFRQFTNTFLAFGVNSVEEKFQDNFNLSNKELEMYSWLGIFSEEVIPMEKASPAQILQFILEKKWTLDSRDKDLIVMQHQFEYEINGKSFLHNSSFGIIGEDQTYTGMAKTVGLPLAIAARLILENKINLKGVHIPVHPEIYKPVLSELQELGINFQEEVKEL